MRRFIYTVPVQEATTFEKIRIPLAQFILWTSVPYLTLQFYQSAWEMEQLKREELATQAQFESEKKMLEEEIKLVQSTPVEVEKRARSSWLW